MEPSEDDARFAREQLATGCDTMEELLLGVLDSKGRVAEEVHGLRKLGKSLRGGFALFRLEKTAAKDIQAIGRLLSGPRDAISRYQTWQKLGWEKDEATSEAIAGLLEQQTHSAARKPPLQTIDWCVERVAAAREKLRDLPEENLAGQIDLGIKKLRKQVSKRCRHLGKDGEENFHDARKALKAYLGAIGFLPGDSTSPEPGMKQLAEILGDENDLATLAIWLDEHGFTADFAPHLWKKIRQARKELQKKAIKDGRHWASSKF